jgi:hypothetical protein
MRSRWLASFPASSPRCTASSRSILPGRGTGPAPPTATQATLTPPAARQNCGRTTPASRPWTRCTRRYIRRIGRPLATLLTAMRAGGPSPTGCTGRCRRGGTPRTRYRGGPRPVGTPHHPRPPGTSPPLPIAHSTTKKPAAEQDPHKIPTPHMPHQHRAETLRSGISAGQSSITGLPRQDSNL